MNDPSNMTTTLPIGTRVVLMPHDELAALRAENATLRELLTVVTGQRNDLQQQLYQALQERVA